MLEVMEQVGEVGVLAMPVSVTPVTVSLSGAPTPFQRSLLDLQAKSLLMVFTVCPTIIIDELHK